MKLDAEPPVIELRRLNGETSTLPQPNEYCKTLNRHSIVWRLIKDKITPQCDKI